MASTISHITFSTALDIEDAIAAADDAVDDATIIDTIRFLASPPERTL